jgi:uncharacterized LabA/DUF88 family protein
MQQSVGVFVDVANIYNNVGKRFVGKKLNYQRYLEQARSYGNIYRAIAYGLEQGKEATNFKIALRHLGFETKYKPLPSSQPEDLKKCSWNVGIAMDIVRIIEKLDTVVIGSNDAALADLVHYIKERGRRCIILGCNIQKELREACNQYVEIREELMEMKNEPVAAAQ